MKNKDLIDFKAIQILFILNEFKKVKGEIKDLKKLFFLTNLMDYPEKINIKLSELNLPLIKAEEYQLNNIESEALLKKNFLTLEDFHISLARLISKSLINIDKLREESIISICEAGINVINQLDTYEWRDIKERSYIIKSHFGNLSFKQLEINFQEIFPKILRGGD